MFTQNSGMFKQEKLEDFNSILGKVAKNNIKIDTHLRHEDIE